MAFSFGLAAKAVNAPLPLGSAAYNLYAILSNAGYSKKDFSSVYQFLANVDKGPQ